MLCCLPVVYVLRCVLVREGNKNRQKITGTYVQNRPHTEKPGKSAPTLPAEKKTLSACHARYSARMELKPRPTCPDGLPAPAHLSVLPKSAPTKRFVRKKTENSQLYRYMLIVHLLSGGDGVSSHDGKSAVPLHHGAD